MTNEDFPTENITVHTLSKWMIIMGILTFLLLQFVTAPFGKHATPHISKWYGPHLNSRVCWLVMEIPNLFQVARVLVNRSMSSSRENDGCSLETSFFSIDAWKNPNPYNVLLCLFTVHYVHRALIYPLIRMRSRANHLLRKERATPTERLCCSIQSNLTVRLQIGVKTEMFEICRDRVVS